MQNKSTPTGHPRDKITILGLGIPTNFRKLKETVGKYRRKLAHPISEEPDHTNGSREITIEVQIPQRNARKDPTEQYLNFLEQETKKPIKIRGNERAKTVEVVLGFTYNTEKREPPKGEKREPQRFLIVNLSPTSNVPQ